MGEKFEIRDGQGRLRLAEIEKKVDEIGGDIQDCTIIEGLSPEEGGELKRYFSNKCFIGLRQTLSNNRTSYDIVLVPKKREEPKQDYSNKNICHECGKEIVSGKCSECGYRIGGDDGS